MTRDRKLRADSVEAAVTAARDAATPILLPPEVDALSTEARRILDGILPLRLPTEWSAPDLFVAIGLARDLAAIEAHAALLAVEGDIVNGRINARHRLIDTATSRCVRAMRTIQIHSKARLGLEARDVARQRAHAAPPRPDDDDDLLAMPGLQ